MVCIVYFVLINDRVLIIVVFVFRVLVVKFKVKLVFWFILIELFNVVLLGVFKEKYMYMYYFDKMLLCRVLVSCVIREKFVILLYWIIKFRFCNLSILWYLDGCFFVGL